MRGGLNFIIESHRIALKIRVTVEKSPVHAVIGNSRLSPCPWWLVKARFTKLQRVRLERHDGLATGLPSRSKELADCFDFLHCEIERTRENRFPVPDGVVRVRAAKGESQTSALSFFSTFSMNFPRREIVPSLQRKKKTLQTRIGLLAVALWSVIHVPLARLPLHRREAPENVPFHILDWRSTGHNKKQYQSHV
jgi:hypothetical protein